MNDTVAKPSATVTSESVKDNANTKSLNTKTELVNERATDTITKERVGAIAAGQKVGDRRGYEAKVTDWLISTAHVKDTLVDKRGSTNAGDKVNDPDAKKSGGLSATGEKVVDRGKVNDRLNIIKVADRTVGRKMSDKRIKICVGNRAISVAKRKLDGEVQGEVQASVSDKRVKICVGGGVPKRRCDSTNQVISVSERTATVVAKQRTEFIQAQDKPRATATVVTEKVVNTDVKLTYKIGDGPSVGERRYLSGDRRNNPVFNRSLNEPKPIPDTTQKRRIDVATVKVRQILKQAKRADASRINKDTRHRVERVVDRRHTVTDNKMSVTVRHYPIKKEEKSQTLALTEAADKQNAADTCQSDSCQADGAAADATADGEMAARADGALPILVF